jgi:hypothetical protein
VAPNVGASKEVAMRRRLLAGILAGLALLAVPTLALAAGAGTTQGVNPSAQAALKGATRTLVVGSDIFIGDKVVTGGSGQVQILFSDNSHLVIGPGSSLSIEDYLIRNNGTGGKFAVDLLSGTFRFATGNGPKSSYELDTPTGIIGVRGTGFDLYVTRQATRVLMYNGIVRLCTTARRCQDLSGLCTLGQSSRGGVQVLGDTRRITGPDHTLLRQQFHYSTSQAGLIRGFRMTNAPSCMNAAPVVDVPQSPTDTTMLFPPIRPVEPGTPPRGSPAGPILY